MDERSVEATLAAVERELAAGASPDLRSAGFWRAVAAVKRRPELVGRHADRIARIDRGAFRRAVRLVFPAPVGIALVAGGLVIDIGFLVAANGLAGPWRDILFLVGFAGLDVATHGLAHLLAGWVAGIRFTDWFFDLPKRPQPGFKIDYASYLRASPRARAWMHASGAIATKLTPFVLLPYGLAIGVATWALLLVAAVGVLQILSDLLFSVKSSDWKKFRREMRLAR